MAVAVGIFVSLPVEGSIGVFVGITVEDAQAARINERIVNEIVNKVGLVLLFPSL